MNEFAKDVGLEQETGNEAPASVTIRGYYKGYSVLVTNRNAGVDVYPIVEKMIKAIDWMEQNGFKPSWNDTPAQQPLPIVDPNAPKCSVHNVPMKWITGISKTTGKNYAFWSCPSKNQDGTYCKAKPILK
jgi:hypothetical protein